MKLPRFSLNVASVALFLAFSGDVLAAEVEKRKEFSIDNDVLEIDNLAGSVSLAAAVGDKFEIQAIVIADDSAGLSAAEIADLIGFDSVRKGGRHHFQVMYPVDEYRQYTYSDGNGRGRHSTSTRYQRHKVSVRSDTRRKSLDVHVDLLIKVPAGSKLNVNNRVGPIDGSDIDAALNLDTGSGAISLEGGHGSVRADTGSGRITSSGHEGDMLADTGSGAVRISDSTGDVEADTGSGSVTISHVSGNVHADTGSGSIELTDVIAGKIFADTGSGSVVLENVSGSLSVDTGSGGLIARNFQAGKLLDVDTGSGSIRIEGNLSAVHRLRLDAGSGGVSVKISELPDMTLRIETGSGGINIDLPGLSEVRSGEGWFEATLGQGGGTGVIDTGSGSVTVSLK